MTNLELYLKLYGYDDIWHEVIDITHELDRIDRLREELPMALIKGDNIYCCYYIYATSQVYWFDTKRNIFMNSKWQIYDSFGRGYGEILYITDLNDFTSED